MIPPKMFLSTGVNDEWFFFGHEGIIQTGKVFYGIFQPWHAKLIVHHAKREIIRNKWLFGKDRIYKRFPVAGKAGKKSPVPFLLRANRAAGSVFRSEERRVGKECVSTCRSRWSPSLEKKKDNRMNTRVENK